MNTLIKKVIEYKDTKHDHIFSEIIDELQGKIDFFCFKVDSKFKDDLRQDILLAIYDEICNFKIHEKSILSDKNCKQLKVEYMEAKNETYFRNFINKYNLKEIDLINSSVEKIIDFLYEYYLFKNENEFKKCITSICYRKSVDAYEKSKKYNYNIISLNKVINDEIELIDLILDEKEDENDFKVDMRFISQKDQKFLSLFIDNEKLLTESEVGKRLGVSQQAISKRLKRIKNNYKTKKNYKNK